MLRYEAATATSQGDRRYQEDAVRVWAADGSASAMVLAVLADGMGGHAGGAIASRLVCDTFADRVAHAAGSVKERLCEALAEANAAIAEKVDASPTLSGMGSTVVGAAFTTAGLEWISVGDSPMYLFRRGEVALLNEDHSLAPALDRLADEGQISHDEARSDPRRHMLRSAVTGEDIDLVDLSPRALPLDAGDYVILASDGIHPLCAEDVGRVVAGCAAAGPQAVANELIRVVIALREPHQDNVTVVVVVATPA